MNIENFLVLTGESENQLSPKNMCGCLGFFMNIENFLVLTKERGINSINIKRNKGDLKGKSPILKRGNLKKVGEIIKWVVTFETQLKTVWNFNFNCKIDW